MTRGRHYAPRRRGIVHAIRFAGVAAGGVAAGLLLAVASMLASLVLIWGVTSLLSYFL